MIDEGTEFPPLSGASGTLGTVEPSARVASPHPERPMSSAQPACAICGCSPATDVTFMQGIGLLLMRRTKTLRVRACRDCGIALFRETQSRTLLTGWWSVFSFFSNLVFLWDNAVARRRLAALGAPVQPAQRSRTQRSTPLPVGKPVMLRPASLGFLAIVIGIVLLAATTDPQTRSLDQPGVTVGTCGQMIGSQVRYPVSCTDDAANARIVAILPSSAQDAECPPTADASSWRSQLGLVCWQHI